MQHMSDHHSNPLHLTPSPCSCTSSADHHRPISPVSCPAWFLRQVPPDTMAGLMRCPLRLPPRPIARARRERFLRQTGPAKPASAGLGVGPPVPLALSRRREGATAQVAQLPAGCGAWWGEGYKGFVLVCLFEFF